jgi:KGK domain
MTDRSKQIIPDSQAVARFLDEDTIKTLDYHGTLTIEELLEKTKIPALPELSLSKVSTIYTKARSDGGYSANNCFGDLKNAINMTDTNKSTIVNKLIEGASCTLLQPDGKGWQKGKLKLCFEFIAEEDDSIVALEKPVKTQLSPLDEIRQLSNELASVGSIEQN